jgi:hypothetical protein
MGFADQFKFNHQKGNISIVAICCFGILIALFTIKSLEMKEKIKRLELREGFSRKYTHWILIFKQEDEGETTRPTSGTLRRRS